MEPASPAPASAPATEPAPAAVEVPGGPLPQSDKTSGTAAPRPVGDADETGPESGDAPGAADHIDEAAPEPAEAKPAREGRSLRDMVMSLGILIVPIGLLLIFYRVVLSGDAPVIVDPTPTIQEAQAAFPVAVPTGLGGDWHVTTAIFRRETTGATLRLGYADPDKDPIQLVESTVPAATLLPAELSTSAKPLETFRAANGVWRLYDGRPGEQALVLAGPSRTIIVVGRTDVRNLQKLASSLS